MTAGDVQKEGNLIVEVFTVKSSEDIELGEVVQNDGSGILAASNAVKGPYFLALEAHTYADESAHDIICLVAGQGDTQGEIATAVVNGRYVEIGLAAGEVTLWDYSSGTFEQRVGIGVEAAATTATEVEVLYGHNG